MSREQLTAQLARAAITDFPGEAALMLEQLPVREVAELLARQDPAAAAGVLPRVRADRASSVVQAMPEPAASNVLRHIEPAVAVSLIARLDPDARAARLAALDRTLSSELTELLTYPPGVAGAIMDPRVNGFRPDTTARDALAQIRAVKNKAITDVFVVDGDGRLSGMVSVQDLALAERATPLGDIALANPPQVQALAPQDDLVALAEDRRVSSVPVVDVVGRLVGVIRHADILSAGHRSAAADMQAMVGASREERALSGVGFAVRKRLPWLQINLATAFLAAAVVGLFENTIAQFTALAVLLPVVAGQSGNTGAQALAVTMRGLALREIGLRHWWRVGRKEFFVGAINGVAVALVTSLGVLVWSKSPGLAGVIGVSMVFSMVMAGAAGASVPMALTALRQDPAAASSIVLTTITDVVGFLSFLGFATLASGLL